jgi:hypothetical protein
MGTELHAMVPPYANLTIDLELLDWKTVEILIDNEHVVKKILKAGQGYEKPNDGTIARGKETSPKFFFLDYMCCVLLSLMF